MIEITDFIKSHIVVNVFWLGFWIVIFSWSCWPWDSLWYSIQTGHQLPMFALQIFINWLVIPLKIWEKCVWRDPIPLLYNHTIPEPWLILCDQWWEPTHLYVAECATEGGRAILLPSAPHRATVAPIDFHWLEVRLLSQSRHKKEHSGPANSDSQLGYTSSLVQIGKPKSR